MPPIIFILIFIFMFVTSFPIAIADILKMHSLFLQTLINYTNFVC